ncbi:MAG: hypothetical protein ACLR6A_09690 [Candidatus Gastranaerophilaceae bacterium]
MHDTQACSVSRRSWSDNPAGTGRMAEDVVMEMVFLKSAIPKKSETVMERRCRVTEPQASVGAVIVNLENLPGEQIRFLVLSEVLRKVFSKKKRTVTISSGKTEEFRISTVKLQGLPRVICLSDAWTDNAVCFSI